VAVQTNKLTNKLFIQNTTICDIYFCWTNVAGDTLEINTTARFSMKN